MHSAAQPRRQFLLGSFSLFTGCSEATTHAPAKAPVATPPDLTKIEATTGGRLGAFAIDTATEEQLAHRADERFAMCSTFKWVLAAALLARVDRREVALDERVSYGRQDLLEYAPVTTAAVADGSMTVEALAAAAVVISDNTAANLLLAKVGGPAGLTRFVRSCGDSVTRLDRLELDLNENAPGDPRDTTSPRAMAGLMRHILCGEDTLSPTSRERLLRWLRECETGKNRLRAGFPSDWLLGDKTGTCGRNAVNDVAIAVPPGRAPVIVAVFTSGGSAQFTVLEAAHAAVARVVAREL